MPPRTRKTPPAPTLGQRIARLELAGSLAPPAPGEPDAITFRMFGPDGVRRVSNEGRTAGLLQAASAAELIGEVTVTLPDPYLGAESGEGSPEAIVAATLTLRAAATPAELRTFPWLRVITSARALSKARWSNEVSDWNAAGRIRAAGTPAQLAPTQKQGRPPTPHPTLRAAADYYRQRQLEGSARPTADLQEHLGITYSRAANLLGRARKAGYLPPTTRGKAGA